jgi:hypothetical protein
VAEGLPTTSLLLERSRVAQPRARLLTGPSLRLKETFAEEAIICDSTDDNMPRNFRLDVR